VKKNHGRLLLEKLPYLRRIYDTHGRIIHKAGCLRVRARTARYNENLQNWTRTTLGPEISRDKICGLLKIFGLLKFLESDALVDSLNVRPGINGRLTYVCSLLKTTAICTTDPQSLLSLRARRGHYPAITAPIHSCIVFINDKWSKNSDDRPHRRERIFHEDNVI